MVIFICGITYKKNMSEYTKMGAISKQVSCFNNGVDYLKLGKKSAYPGSAIKVLNLFLMFSSLPARSINTEGGLLYD